MSTINLELDGRDLAIVKQRCSAYLQAEGPQVGDFVRFADGVERRISHVWPADWHEDNVASVQTIDGGWFYLADGRCSFSGGLHPGVKVDTLELTGVCRRGLCWFFHHDWAMKDNSVDVELPIFNEWACSQEARAAAPCSFTSRRSGRWNRLRRSLRAQ